MQLLLRAGDKSELLCHLLSSSLNPACTYIALGLYPAVPEVTDNLDQDQCKGLLFSYSEFELFK